MFMRLFRFCLILAATAAGGFSCRHEVSPGRLDYEALPAFAGGGVHVVIESPAGTSRLIEYREGAFQPAGGGEVIRFLPFPGNLGFIPSTAEPGGEGADLDVLLISESLPTGTVTEVLPVGALRMEAGGREEIRIIAVPLDTAAQIIPVAEFRDFLIGYDAARHIIEDWFAGYRGIGSARLLGWEDERYAMDEIRRRARVGE